ncbi:MAG TPA: trypsin-like serine protease [Gaiellaceae bacterium]|nr:trypsin-like serine protease [Gaiellaceae bacterium]
MSGRYKVIGALAVFAAIVLAPAGVRASATANATAATASIETEAIGALFTLRPGGALGSHFCTATVIDSSSGDVVVTAAHCLAGRKAGTLAFVPGYHNGARPFGVWKVTRIIVNSTWARAADPDHDFAFLVVHRARAQSSLQALTGGERLGVVDPIGKQATVVGYPAAASAAIRCSNTLRRRSATQLEFDCAGYTNGTSGSALVIKPSADTGLGTVVGVIGGYQQGGNTSSVSYAAAFGVSALALYRQAANAA